MKFKTIQVGFLVFIFSSSLCQCFSQSEQLINNYQEYSFENTEVRTFHSRIVGQDYEIVVSLPKSYSVKDTVFPVIFLLDPYRVFSMVKGYTDVLTTPYTYMPEVIIVGIGNGGKGREEMFNWALGRTRDLTPVKSTATEEIYRKRFAAVGAPNVEIQTGGAPLFLDYIKKELFPFVETNYRIDNFSRMLSGYSLGGLFAMYVLFHEPGLFSKYFIGSPSIHYKDGITFEYESNYAGNYSDLQADVFINAGALEDVTSQNVTKIEGLLSSRNYENLYLKSVIFDHENHVTCYPAAMGRGLIELYNKEHNNSDNLKEK
jgi:predicted alpha/beta superfamily hydrolase